MYTFNFKPDSKVEVNDIHHFLKVISPPQIPFAQELIQTMSLGDGTTIVRHTGIYSDIVIQLECNFLAEKREEYLSLRADIDKYFGDKKGLLELSEDQSHYWKVKDVVINSGTRILGRASDLTIDFTCEPYRYFKTYSKPIEAVIGNHIEFNNFFSPSFPIYKIYNDSVNATSLSISNNGKALTITNPFKGSKTVSYLEINTEWNYLKAVYTDGSFEYVTGKTSGSFADLRFKSGINDVTSSIDVGSCRIEVKREYREL